MPNAADPSIEELLDVAIAAAKEASQHLTEEYDAVHGSGTKDLKVETKTSDIDVVTAVDGRTQQIIIEHIQETFPDHRFIAEEEGADNLGSPDSPYAWVIDPLDGTVCFIHGKPNFGTIVAVQYEGVTVAGAMSIPLMNKYYHAAKGMGAFLNDKRIESLRETTSLTDAVLCSNLVHRAKEDANGILQIATPYCRSLQNYGSAVEEIADVLDGYADGTFFQGIRLWDIAAGFLMVLEAGGKAHYEFEEHDNPRSGLKAVASTSPIYDELWEFVNESI